MIYVDPIFTAADVQIKAPAKRYGRRWCHLSDDENDVERLHAFAAKMGIPRSWYQLSANGTFPHYDLTPRLRARALMLGAVAVTSEEAARISVDQVKTRRQFPKGDRRYGRVVRDGRDVGVFAVRARRDPSSGGRALRLPL